MLYTVLIYVICYVICISLFIRPFLLRDTIAPKHALFLYIYASVVLFALTFNIGYTALLGWHHFATTLVEFILDCITAVLDLVGFIGYYYTLHIVNRAQKEKLQAKIARTTIGFRS